MMVKRQHIRKRVLAGMLVVFQYRLFHLFFSPVLVVVAASQGVVNGSLLMYAALFVTSLYFGRAWCGWLCPGTAINEVCALAVHKPAKVGKANRVKFVVFGLWAGLIGFMAIRAGGFHVIDPFFGMGQRSVVQDILLLFGAFVIIVPFSFGLGKFANCHYLCWVAPIMIIGTKIKEKARWPSLHLAAHREVCRSCEQCDRHCPMGLPVSVMVRRGNLHNAECILCGNCVDQCQTGAIRFSFGRPDKTSAATSSVREVY